MLAYQIDPLQDDRWQTFIARHPSASIFHTRGWLEALRRTYGFTPVVLTTTPPHRPLTNGIAFCRVRSWLTGRRLVSLPFSDHCEPLAEKPQEVQTLFESLARLQESEKWKYVELRPLSLISEGGQCPAGFAPSSSYYIHSLDLRPSLDELMAGFHKDCVQRKIRRAEHDGVSYEEGRSESQLRQFYALQLRTRRRQKLPPQPYAWFRNLAECLGAHLTVRVASYQGKPVASIITARHNNTMVYKYGCSDERASSHGGTQMLFWRAIQDAKALGLVRLDLGRSDRDNPGLIDFKDRWGATKSNIVYLRYTGSVPPRSPSRKIDLARRIVSTVPDLFLSLAGSLLYRHLA
jgi:hypothetical protein